MKREQAIKIIVKSEVDNLNILERSEILKTMVLEDWSQCDLWNDLSSELQQEFDSGELNFPPDSVRYDLVLAIYFADHFVAVTNEYLIEKLKQIGHNIIRIEGKPKVLKSCPCCGRRTIEEHEIYDICPVCWWEDDGSDNDSADQHSGPNHLSLLEARLNFLQYGIFDPKRVDLAEIKQPSNKYSIGRKFYLKDGQIVEAGSQWRSNILN